MVDVGASGVVILKDGKVVLVQENKDYNRGLWNLPCGKLEPNENIFKAAVREAKEETNLDVELDGLVGVYQSINQKGVDAIRFIFKAKVLGGVFRKQEDELLDARWFDLEEVKRMRIEEFSWPGVRDAVMDCIHRGTIDSKYLTSYIK